MRICHIITRLIIGGAQENTILTCEGLHARGHDVTLMAGPTDGPEGSLLDRVRAGHYRFIECPPLVRRISPIGDIQALLDLQKLLLEIQPDVVHTHTSKAGILARAAARRTGIPLIVHTIHGMSFNRTQRAAKRGLFRALERRCGRYTDHFVTVSDAMIRQAVAAGIAPVERFSTIFSGMELERFDPAAYSETDVRANWGFEREHVVVGSIARLFRNKGYEELIPTVARAAAANPTLRFVWIGDGAQRDDYERRLDRLGLRDRVYLAGLVPPAEIPRMLSGIDMLVHASRWEGLPRAVVQALLMEKPAISFDVDGAPEVVRHGETGLLAPLGDTQCLAGAILDLAGDAQRRRSLGRAGRRLCFSRFGHDRMVDAIEALYGHLAAARGIC
ncbi:MAG: glycosyltransferase family 4 protein [Phycisphaerae bacterium]